MGSCFHFELLVRLLAQKHFAGESVTRDIADGRRGEGLLSLLFGKLTFTDEERAFLPKCNRLRNKLIHCEPDGVLKVVQELVPAFDPSSNVRKFVFPPDSTGETIMRVLDAHEDAVDVQDTTSRTDGFLGWMMQAATDGTFDLAVELLQYGMAIVDAKSRSAA